MSISYKAPRRKLQKRFFFKERTFIKGITRENDCIVFFSSYIIVCLKHCFRNIFYLKLCFNSFDKYWIYIKNDKWVDKVPVSGYTNYQAGGWEDGAAVVRKIFKLLFFSKSRFPHPILPILTFTVTPLPPFLLPCQLRPPIYSSPSHHPQAILWMTIVIPIYPFCVGIKCAFSHYLRVFLCVCVNAT